MRVLLAGEAIHWVPHRNALAVYTELMINQTGRDSRIPNKHARRPMPFGLPDYVTSTLHCRRPARFTSVVDSHFRELQSNDVNDNDPMSAFIVLESFRARGHARRLCFFCTRVCTPRQ